MFTNALHTRIKNTFVKQDGPSDGGVACLVSIVNYCGGDVALEKIRDLSGTSIDGTTMLGLYQAAQHAGFSVEGLQADEAKSLLDLQSPVIIHVILDGAVHNFFVYYGFDYNQDKFILGDPQQGIVFYSLHEVEAVWQTKSLLKLTPNENFVKKVVKKDRKRRFFSELIKDDLNTLFLTTFLSLIISFIGFSIAFFSQELIDNTLPDGDEKKIFQGFGLIALLLLGSNLTVYLKNLFNTRRLDDKCN